MGDGIRILVYVPAEYPKIVDLGKYMSKRFGDKVVVSSELEDQLNNHNYDIVVDTSPAIESDIKASILPTIEAMKCNRPCIVERVTEPNKFYLATARVINKFL